MATPNARPAPAMDARGLMEMHFSFGPSRILSSGVQLGIFTEIAAGHRTVPDLARAIGASQRGTRMLANALTGFGLLSKRDGAYDVTEPARRYLVKSSPDYMGAVLEDSHLWDAWNRLPEIVRSGKPEVDIDDQPLAEEFFPALVRTLHVMNRELAQRLAEALGAGTSYRRMHVLDVACGSGVWGIAVAEADPQAKITALDFPKLLDITREYTKRHGVERQYDYLPGDLKQTDLGENQYDLVILGHIVHSEGERSSRDLFRRVHRALKPGGRVAILDMIPNDERTGPPFPLMFAIEMLLRTPEGDTYTLPEYTAWLREAGFAKMDTADIGSFSPAIIGTRR